MHRPTDASLRSPRLTLLLAAILGALGVWSFLRASLSAGADAYIGADQPELRGTVGRAVVSASWALELGFLGMPASNLQTLADTAWLSAAAIGAALVTELIVPPIFPAVASRTRVEAGAPACIG